MAGFLSMVPASRAMCEEAAQARTYDYNGVQYPRMRFLTVAEVLEDRREFHVPTKVNTRIATAQAALPL